MPQKDDNTGKKVKKHVDDDGQNLKVGFLTFLCIFGLAFVVDYLVKSRNPYIYIPGTQFMSQNI